MKRHGARGRYCLVVFIKKVDAVPRPNAGFLADIAGLGDAVRLGVVV